MSDAVAGAAARAGLGPLQVGDRVEFELFDFTRNAARRYAMEVVRDTQLPLFEGEPPALVLVVSRGRIGSPGVVTRTRFVDMEKLRARWHELVLRRRRHHYAEVSRGA